MMNVPILGNNMILVGGLDHLDYVSIIYGMSSFPLTFIFFKMVQTTNQDIVFKYHFYPISTPSSPGKRVAHVS